MRAVRAVRAIAGVELRRFLADRSNIFFVFFFPLLLVLVIGAQFGDGGTRGQVVLSGPDSALTTSVETALDRADLGVTRTGVGEVREAVARGRADAGLVVTPEAAAAADSGEDPEVVLVPGSQASAQAAVLAVRSALRAVSLDEATVAAVVDASGADHATAREAVDAAAEEVARPSLEVVDVDEVAQQFAGVGRFELGAAGQLLLFTFLISLAGSESLIRARRDKVVGRTLAAPVPTRAVVLGQVVGRLVIAGFQGAYIMLATALLFGVDWGALHASLLVLALFALVAAGAALVLGSVIDNDAAAGGIGVGVGLVLGALGGAMFPLELLPESMRTVAHLTPHAWAYEAFAEIQRREGGVLDVLPQLGVLAGFAVVLVLVGAWLLRRSLARAI